MEEALRPLTYESLKTVLQYIEPNLRFKLAGRIPSIASTEKVVPLKINRLEFYPHLFVVNGTHYKLGTHRHYPPDVEPLLGHLEDNFNGGVPFDLDQYGFADYSQEDIITAGDVVIKDTRNRRAPLTEEQASELESQMEVYEYVLAKRYGRKVEPLDRNHPNYHLIELCKQHNAYEINYFISGLKTRLAPVYCRRKETHFAYSTMIQLTIKSSDMKWKIDRIRVEKKLYEVEKELANRLFGNRKSIAFVKHLEVGFWPLDAAQMVIRLPPNFKIKVREMCVTRNTFAVCNALQSLVHNSSYPLDQIQVYYTSPRRSAHPIACNAKRVRFTDATLFGGRIDEFLQFNNQSIYLNHNLFTPDQHIQLLREWIARRREVGTCFVSKIGEKATITEIFENCKEHLGGAYAGKWSMKVPFQLSKSSEINLSYKFIKKRSNWMLTIRVITV